MEERGQLGLEIRVESPEIALINNAFALRIVSVELRDVHDKTHRSNSCPASNEEFFSVRVKPRGIPAESVSVYGRIEFLKLDPRGYEPLISAIIR